ncbi:MAG: hypothetical protein ACKVS6_16155 [Planctomycetota bacterium]
MKKLIRIFAALGGLATGGYAVSEYTGWEPTSSKHHKIDPNIRKSPGGWRSYTFWHQGVHGGK